MRHIFVRKLLNNTKIAIGWRNMAGIRKLKYRGSFEKRPIYVRKLLNYTKFGIA